MHIRRQDLTAIIVFMSFGWFLILTAKPELLMDRIQCGILLVGMSWGWLCGRIGAEK